MKITHYLYNAFIIESGDKKIAIDPGALFFYWFRFNTLIPKAEWSSITHILMGLPENLWVLIRSKGALPLCRWANPTLVGRQGSSELNPASRV